MKVFNIAFTLLLSLLLGACSSTSPVDSSLTSTGYYAKQFPHTEFSANNKNTVKKPMTSDQALMISLLNRPVPEDQKMMLAYAKQQKSYFPDSTIVGIQIRGSKTADKLQQQNTSVYAELIEQDVNSVTISAMPK